MNLEQFPMVSPELPPRENENGKEKERQFDLDFYVTDHSADSEATGSPEKLHELYTDIKKDGIESVRYDWHWRNIEPKPGEYSEEHLERYARAKEIMAEAGLKEPTIILSNPPEWAKKLYKEDKEKFFEEYAMYVAEVKKGLEMSGGEKVKNIQILNELNNAVYTPVKVEDLARMCQITREVFKDYNPDVKLMATLLASNTTKFVGTPIEEYLPEFQKIKDSFDMVAVDYYPGMWHLPTENGKNTPQPLELAKKLLGDKVAYYKSAVKDMGLLEDVFRELATWGKEYELGEVGMRTNPSLAYAMDEKGQRYFYDAFSRAFKHMMVRFRNEGIQLPSRIGFYEAMDEPAKNRVQSLGRQSIPFAVENDMGMRTGDGRRKMILEGNPHASEEEQINQPSQLRKVISYLRAPMEKAEHSENAED